MVTDIEASGLDYPDSSEAVPVVVSEAERAQWLRDSGQRVIEYRGRYWRSKKPGLYEPIHLLARLSENEARRPTPTCWGYRAALTDQDRGRANGSIPVHLIADLDGYGMGSLAPNKRNELRKCMREIRFVHVTHSRILREQGWEVLLLASARAPISTPKSRARYGSWADTTTRDKRWTVIAGLNDGVLAGYMTAFAVDSTAYVESLVVRPEYLQTGVAVGLYYEMVQAFKRTGLIREMCTSLHLPENQGLTAYKERIGFPVVHIPADASSPAR